MFFLIFCSLTNIISKSIMKTVINMNFCILAECEADSDCPYDKTCVNRNCVSPCLNALVTCGRGAECTAAAHRAQCSCPPGTQGDPRVACIQGVCHYNEDCADDETCDRLNRVCRKVCSDDSCADDAICQAQNHELKCSCSPGTKGNPYVECLGEPFEPDCTEDRQCPSHFACINARCQDPCLVANMCSSDRICRVFPTENIRTIICECAKDAYTDENGNCRKHGKKIQIIFLSIT